MFSINKWKLAYLIFGVIGVFVLAYFEITGRFQYPIIILYALLFFILTIYLHRAEKNKIMKLQLIYIHDLEPLIYLSEYEKYNKRRLRSKTFKTLDKINSVVILIDAGEIEEAHRLLMELTEEEPEFGIFLRFWFYNAWIHYFDQIDDLPRMKVLLEEIKKLLPLFPLKQKPKMYANYEMISVKVGIREGKDLEAAENYLTYVLRGHLPKITVLKCIYQLGIIAHKKGAQQTAKNRFLAVIANGKNLNITRKAKAYLEKIEPSISEENSQ